MFERTLTDVVKGIRASKRDTALYISQCIAEIKTEISSNDLYVKANALQKLTFLQMLGYSMSWASFATIEVMSSPRFGQKRIGYLAASQGFTQDTEVILLTTNLLKKELRGAVGGGMHGVYEAGLAINCISNIVTEDLATDLLPELTSLMAHPQPYLRKKAILCLFKVFMKYPQGLRLTFAKLQQALQDPNPSVVSCAVNVITELSDKNPKNYLHLAPAFFELLTGSSNNWMLIKVVKLLGSLVPEEPRLARKLLEPLANIVRNTQAKSLLYEAVYTITLCLPYCRKADGSMPANVPDIVELSAKTLGSFVEESDQNLKYLGLVGFASLMASHPKVLSASEYRPLILACLSDQDVTIRRRALDLLIGMTSRKNLMELVAQLLKHVQLASGSYRNDLIAKIIELCSAEKYSLLSDFGWYIDVLFHIGHLRGIETHGELLRAQITDVALRVLPIRAYAVRRSMLTLLERDGNVSNDPRGDNGRGKNIMPDVLPALAWIVGEYSDLIREAIGNGAGDTQVNDFAFDASSQGCYHALLQVLACPSNTQTLGGNVQKIYMQGAMKVFAAATADPQVVTAELSACLNTIHIHLPIFTQSADVEVAERAFTALKLLQSLDIGPEAIPSNLSALQKKPPGRSSGNDLLGLHQGKENKFSQPSSMSISNLKNASSILNFLFKPSPMKPIGSKAQRKKLALPVGHSVDLNTPVDVSIFSEYIDQEEMYRVKAKLKPESVDFTQQRPPKIVDSHEAFNSDAISNAGMPDGGFSSSPHQSNGFGRSFQHIGEGGNIEKPLALNSRQSDPFYLASSSTKSTEVAPDSRFGTIELSDSDEDATRHRKHKKKKDKKPRHLESATGVSASSLDGNLWSLEGNEESVLHGQQVIHESDDEDGVDEKNTLSKTKKKGTSKGFTGLARVDLTTPLREDEIVPIPRHRVVPNQPSEDVRSKKKQKKAKKEKATRGKQVEIEDLLDLGGLTQPKSATAFSSFTPKSSPETDAPIAPSSPNLINSAFDDLLGLTLVPSHQVSNHVSEPQPSNACTTRRRPWMRASLKISNAEGHSIDWSKVTLLYRVYSKKSSLSLVFKLENNSSAVLPGLTMTMNDHADISMGDVAGGSFVETEKLGRFEAVAEESMEKKGLLTAGIGESVSFRISLPVSIQFDPEENLSLDQISHELCSSQWFSNSSKVEVLSDATLGDAFCILAAFLRASTVEGGTAEAATFAARSNAGTRVRALAKLKGQILKVDIKSTSAAVGKSIASDIKRLVL